MNKGKTTLNQKDPEKGTAPNNYRPIMCLLMMWKIQTAAYRLNYDIHLPFLSFPITICFRQILFSSK